MTAAPGVDRKVTPALMLTALGIVYGDLGTSPLYAMQAVVGALGTGQDPRAALGVLSLIAWALVVTISVKYCALVMRADNAGEGGILALMSLVTGGKARPWALVAMGLFGAALIYGDGAITPAISVLSALEGLTQVTGSVKPYVLPLAVVILAGLFAAQTLGTAKIGRVFGPVMLVWFVVIAILGVMQVVAHPAVLKAANPLVGLSLLAHHPAGSLALLGGVFLVVTGGEALYADMGHVGRAPIRAAWLVLVLPALLLSYAGQTAHMVASGGLTPDDNPFWQIVPHWAVIPLVALATLATIIASQAIITGAFSLTRQAMQLGWLPGMRIRQTSAEEYGQIYVPVVNWAMMVATLAIAVAFGSSDRLAGAYGTAVSTTMLLTTALLYFAMVRKWGWSPGVALGLAGGLLLVDVAFFAANLVKIGEGGWLPLLMGALLFAAMIVWSRGIAALRVRLSQLTMPADRFLARLEEGRIPRVPGTAVFLSRADIAVPAIMVRHVADMGALHQRLASLAVVFEPMPRVREENRLEVREVTDGFWHLIAHYGFVEIPDLASVLTSAREHGCDLGLEDAVYFGSRDEVVPRRGPARLSSWIRLPFAVMYRNALRTVDRFRLPTERFVEVARQIEL